MIVPQYELHLKILSHFLIEKAAYPQVNVVKEDIYTTIHKH